MELAIEKWLSNYSFDQESMKLFQESVVCYKAGAYRAGFLFSYLGSQSVIKNRVLEANCPDDVKEFFWNEITQRLINDDEWENAVWEAYTAKKHGEIFKIGDGHLKIQLEYWRGIRNDCAHAKDNEIIAAHVESYWAFLRSNMPKIVVTGGKDSIINRIKKHFDIKYTPSNTDPIPIVQDMESGVKESDLEAVYKELAEQTKDNFDYVLGLKDSEPALFWKRILDLESTSSLKCVAYLKECSPEVLYHILDVYPSLVTILKDDPEYIRNTWFEKIDEFIRPLDVLAALLDHDCVPQEQIEEAINNTIHKVNDTELDNIIIQRLNHYGFSSQFKNCVFIGLVRKIKDFEWANSHCRLVCSYLKEGEVDKEIISSISDVFYPSNHPYDLRDSLLQLFSGNVAIKEVFIKISAEEGIELPKRLGF